MIATLERDPRFRVFTLDGQTVLLEDYLELRPEQEPRLRALLAAGRLAVGPSYVLPDELLVGGESLVRNLLLGRAVCERLGARTSRVGYLPDSFGHPAQLPQILAGFGIESFLFSRGVGDEVDDVGRIFRWTAPDGSAVTAFNLPGHYDSAVHLRSGDDLADRARRLAERYGLRDVVLCNGSDHQPVQPELPRFVARARRLLGAPVRLSSFDEFAAEAAPGRRLRPFHGELIGGREQNVLRGVNSARMYLKQANERVERRLLAAETAAGLAALAGRAPFPGADFRFAWRELLRNQPHDSICGCSVDEVHDDMLERYAKVERTVDVLERKALVALAGAGNAPGSSLTLLNPLPWRRRRLVRLELPPELRRARGLVARSGDEELPVERAGREALVAVDLDGFASAQLELSASASPGPSNTVLRGSRRPWIAGDRYRVEAASDGTLRVVDLDGGVERRGLLRFEDEPDIGDLYTFCPAAGGRAWRSDARGVERSARVLRRGAVSELELTTATQVGRGRVECRTVIRLIDGVERIELETEIVNRARDHRLRVVFPVPGAGETVRAESPFAVVERPLHPAPTATAWVEPAAATAHTLGAVALGDLVLLTKGLPEYEAREGELALTLLRCVGVISRPDGLATRPYGAGPGTPTPGGQCLGRHRFEYAIRFGALALDDATLVREAHDYRFDFLAGPPGDTPPPRLALSGDPVAFSCLKGAEDGDGLVLRLYNPSGKLAHVRLATEATIARCRLDETSERPAGRALRLRPGEIATLRLRLRSQAAV